MKAIPLAYTENSTSVRKRTATRPWWRPVVTALDAVLPQLTARVAEELFLTPPRFAAPPQEAQALSTAHPFEVAGPRGPIAAWSWGDGPTVVLVHGWGGRAGQFHAFVEPLLQNGFSVVAFDAPGHGQTPGRRSSLADFAAALEAVVAAVGPVHSIIAHSLGAAATVVAMQEGLKAPRAVFLAPPASPDEYAIRLARQLGISDATRARMKSRIERRLGLPWSRVRIAAAARNLTAKLLIVHDQNDTEVPWHESAGLAASWSGARLLTTHRLGHYRVLRDAAVVRQIVGFLTS